MNGMDLAKAERKKLSRRQKLQRKTRLPTTALGWNKLEELVKDSLCCSFASFELFPGIVSIIQDLLWPERVISNMFRQFKKDFANSVRPWLLQQHSLDNWLQKHMPVPQNLWNHSGGDNTQHKCFHFQVQPPPQPYLVNTVNCIDLNQIWLANITGPIRRTMMTENQSMRFESFFETSQQKLPPTTLQILPQVPDVCPAPHFYHYMDWYRGEYRLYAMARLFVCLCEWVLSQSEPIGIYSLRMEKNKGKGCLRIDHFQLKICVNESSRSMSPKPNSDLSLAGAAAIAYPNKHTKVLGPQMFVAGSVPPPLRASPNLCILEISLIEETDNCVGC